MSGKINLDEVLSSSEGEIILRADIRRLAFSIQGLDKFEKSQFCKRFSVSEGELNSVIEFSEKLLKAIKERSYNA